MGSTWLFQVHLTLPTTLKVHVSPDLASSFRWIHTFPKYTLQPLMVTTLKARKWKAGKGCLLHYVCFYSTLDILLIIWRIRGALFLGKDWIQLYNGNLHLQQELNVEEKRQNLWTKNAEWREMKNASLKCLKLGLLSYGIVGTWSGLVNI